MVLLRKNQGRHPTLRRKSCPGTFLRPWLEFVPERVPRQQATPHVTSLRPHKTRQMDDTRIHAATWQALGQMAGGESLSLRVSGECMEPFLKNQARVLVRRCRVYLPGDVLVVQRPSRPPVIHRLIGLFPTKGSLRYLTQADNSPTPDGSVTREAILGKVCGGECSPLLLNVPFRHRAKAVSIFLTFVGSRLKHRTWSLLKTT